MVPNNLLKISKEDLKSAIVLYENKNYTQALFYFQQAVEKATKYLAMSCGITEDEFRKKIKHNGMKLFKEIYKRIQGQNDFMPIETGFISDLSNFEVELKSLSNQDLIYLLLRQISSVYEMSYPIATQDMSRPLQLVIDYLIKSGTTHELIVKPFTEWEYVYTEEKLKTETLKTIAAININSKVAPLLFFLTVFSNRYKVDDFRYPSSTINDPIEYFTVDNPYVSGLPKVFPILENTIDMIEKMTEINNSLVSH